MRFTDEQVDMLRHDNVTGDDETVAESYEFESVFEEIACGGCSEMLLAVVTTEGEEVEVIRMFVTDKSSGHWWSLVRFDSNVSDLSHSNGGLG